MSPSEFRDRFEPLFQKYLNKVIERSKKITSSKKTQEIIDYIKIVGSNGKRIRPYMAYLGFGAGKKIEKEIVHQLIGIELVHLMAIIHDDIIDRSESRHGVKTIHTKEKDQHLGNSFALLAGDITLNWANEAFSFKNSNENSKKIFFTLIEEVIVGETMDVEMSTRKNWTEKEINEKTILKSARYTFRRPVEIGVSLRKTALSNDKAKIYSKISEDMGIIFQIDDDLLDIFGDEKKINKKTFQDIETSQATLISFYLKDNKDFKKYFGKKLNSKEREDLKELINKSGVLDKIEKYKSNLIQNTEKLISKTKDKIIWTAFLNKLIKRDK